MIVDLTGPPLHPPGQRQRGGGRWSSGTRQQAQVLAADSEEQEVVVLSDSSSSSSSSDAESDEGKTTKSDSAGRLGARPPQRRACHITGSTSANHNGLEGPEASNNFSGSDSDSDSDLEVIESHGGGCCGHKALQRQRSSASGSSSSASSASPGETIPIVDWRQALLNGTPEDRSLLDMLEKEQQEREAQLASRTYECSICGDDELPLHDMLTLSCDHRFCKGCFSQFCELKIGEAAVKANQLTCPNDGCHTPISVYELSGNLSKETFEKYERFCLRAFAKDTNALFCPRCEEWFCEANLDEANVSTWRAIRCGDPKCGHTFCGRCGQTPHRRDPGAAAATPGKRPELDVSCESFAQSLKAGRDDAVNMEMTRAFLKANGDVTQECPSCHATGTQIAGVCKFAFCSCGVFFCFVCGSKLTQADHYRHFTGPGLAGPFGNVCLGPSDPNWKRQQQQNKKKNTAKKPARAPRQRKPQKKKQPPAPKVNPKRRKAKNNK